MFKKIINSHKNNNEPTLAMQEFVFEIPDQRHTDDMQDIITTIPIWLMRWGTTLFFAFLVLIFGLSAFIRYPDIVNATLKIDSLNPAEPIVSKISGKLDRLLITSHEIVKVGQPLVCIGSNESPASKCIITASQTGRVSFSEVIHENMVIRPNQVLFYIIPAKEDFVGEMVITQSNMAKVKEGQQVLVKLRSYPFEEYGIIRGKIKYISDVPFNDSAFIARVDFRIKNISDTRKPINLKQGMMAEADIITQDATVLQRLVRNFFKLVEKK